MASALHVITYLSEVLAPVWELEPLDGKVLKLSTAPYYPTLQQDIDRLIGMGLIRVDDLKPGRTEDGTPILLPRVSLEVGRTGTLLKVLRDLPGEAAALDFLWEVVQAFSRLSDAQVPASMNEDATYGSPGVDTGQVIDLGEWLEAEETATSHVTHQIRKLAGDVTNPAEVIDMYINHIAYRVSHE
jgi:hypothetical protein